MDEDEERQA